MWGFLAALISGALMSVQGVFNTEVTKQTSLWVSTGWVQLSAFMGIAYAVLSLLFTRQMVGFFQLADAEAHTAAMSYTRIACGLIVFSFLTLTLTGIYTAQGDSKTPFLANLVGLAMNMILDPVLILGPGIFPRLGVTGAAIATVTAQAIVMSIMILGDYSAEERKCTKRNKTICKTSTGICEWNL